MSPRNAFDDSHSFAGARWNVDKERTFRKVLQDLIDQQERLFDLANANPYPGVDVALGQNWHVEAQTVIGRIAEYPSRIECTPGGAADVAARAELLRQRGFENSRSNGAILQRGRIVVEFDQRRKFLPHFFEKSANRGDTWHTEVNRNPAGYDAIPHQPMAEARVRGTEDAFAQYAAMRMNHRERGVIADGSDVTEMIRKTFHFRHQTRVGHARAAVPRSRVQLQRRERKQTRRRRCCHRRCDRQALQPRSKSAPIISAFDSLMNVAEALLQPHDGLAICGEAKMARLDDAGMHRTDWNLMQTLAIGRQEQIRWLERHWVCAAPADGLCPSGHGRARDARQAHLQGSSQRDHGSCAPSGSPADGITRRTEIAR